MKKIAFIFPHFFPHIGGTETRFYEIGKRIAAWGNIVHMFTINYNSELSNHETIDGIHVHRIKVIPSFDRRLPFLKKSVITPIEIIIFTIKLAIVMRQYEIDLYYAGGWPLVNSIVLSRLFRPYIQEWTIVVKRLVPFFLQLSKIEQHVVVSNTLHQKLLKFSSIQKDKIKIVINGVSNKYYTQKIRKKIGRIIFIGRLVPHKRVDLLIEAFRMVIRTKPNSELLIIGNGPLLHELMEQCQDLENVYFLKQISERRKFRFLNSSWLFVLPSEREGFGIVVAESLVSGTPVLILNFPNNAAINEFSEGVLIVEPKIEEIALKINELMDDETKWIILHEDTKKSYSKFNWDNISQDLFEYFDDIIDS